MGGGEISGFQILGELGNGGGEGIAALRAGSWREQSVLLAAGNQLLKRREIALSLGQVAGLQVLSEELKALLKLLLVGILRGGRTELAENAAGNTKLTVDSQP